ncbi:MAG TPA: nucleotidyl transferase AbiEii/AbiGii toxin family protein [Cyclobacteriaceae bacterium]|nr:nucleotidyl transferase AbiEii/AbiGii toxin family protein [Cyclobacteriaceae bacterium]
MNANHRDNLRRIKKVSEALSDLNNKVVFVGGATISMYADRENYPTRITEDVDAIVEVLGIGAHADFEHDLRTRGFVDEIYSGVRCRYLLRNGDERIVVDIMPTKDIAMGFENRWYEEGYSQAIAYSIDDQTIVKILTPPHFLATKLEAFKSRGHQDPRTSPDFEDIVYVLENRRAIWDEITSANEGLKKYLRHEFSLIINSPDISEWIDSHVSYPSPPPTYLIIDALKEFVSTSNS